MIANGFVHLAVPDTAGAPIAVQATEILTRIDALLASAGIDKTRVLTANIWLSDAAHFDAFNAVWDAWVPAGHAPTRACAGVADETRSRRRDRRDRARLTPAPPARGIPDDIRHARPGGGMIGVSVAVHLQQRGLSVALVDRKAPGNETSLGNAGLIQREGVYPYAFPRGFGTLLKYACNRSPDVRYHVGALPKRFRSCTATGAIPIRRVMRRSRACMRR